MKKETKGKTSIYKSIFIILIIGIVIAYVTPILLKNLKFGLDLQGGFEVLYKVESIDGKDITNDMLTSTYKTIAKRIDVLGVSEPEIVVEGRDRIRVQLAGVTDSSQARETLSAVASLTFRDSKNNLLMNSNVLKSGAAKVGQDNKGKPAVSLSIADKDTFYSITKMISETEDKLIVIWLDFIDGVSSYENEGVKCGSSGSKCLSAASVTQGFSSDVIIQGNFTLAEVENLVNLINSGSLPTKLTEISSKTVAASFGVNSLELTAKAGVIGIALILVLMILIYRFAGLISSIGLIIYTFLTFVSFWLFGGVLTLPGIAALVLGIAMAIDSSVITFARIKDELKEDVSLEGAIKKGNKNSISAIFDANFTTMLVAVIMFIFGETSVKGFATMLIISTIVTMIVMVYLTRFLLGLFVNTGIFTKRPGLFIGFKKNSSIPKINFIKIRKFVYIYFILLICVGVYSLCTNKLTLGIDFKGGSSISIVGTEKLDLKNIKKEITDLGYKIYSTEKVDDKNVVYKVEESLDEAQVLEAEGLLHEKYNVMTDIGVVTNIVKQTLIKNAIISIVLAIIGLILYVAFRFKFSYSLSCIIALLHDAFVLFVVFSLFKLEVTSIFIAAILSIIGFSINDTIVTFDRIRESIKNKKGEVKSKEELASYANEALNITLGRTIILTLTTLCPIITLIVFGAHEIINFNIAMLAGLIAGVLSTIFMSGAIWYDLEKRSIGKPKKKKWYEEDEPKKKITKKA